MIRPKFVSNGFSDGTVSFNIVAPNTYCANKIAAFLWSLNVEAGEPVAESATSVAPTATTPRAVPEDDPEAHVAPTMRDNATDALTNGSANE